MLDTMGEIAFRSQQIPRPRRIEDDNATLIDRPRGTPTGKDHRVLGRCTSCGRRRVRPGSPVPCLSCRMTP